MIQAPRASRRGWTEISARLAAPALLAMTIVSDAMAQEEPCVESKLLPPSPSYDQDFGRAVAIDGEVVVVGSTFADSGATNDGAAYVFRWNPTLESWELEAELLASDGEDSDVFGVSVDVRGDMIVVGSSQDDVNGIENAGSVFFFVRDLKTESWLEQQQIVSANAFTGDLFGTSLQLDNGVLIVGAPEDDLAVTNRGKAEIFRFDAQATSWIHEATVEASDGGLGDNFGRTVGIRGDVAVIGAYWDDHAGGVNAGSAYIFRRVPAEGGGFSWLEEVKLIASDTGLGDQFGRAVAIRDDVVIVGASHYDVEGVTNAGAVYVFRYDDIGDAWIEETTLVAADFSSSDFFGTAVGMHGDTVLVGAPYADRLGSSSGAVYEFRFEPVTASWTQTAALLAPDGGAGDLFGWAVGADADQHVIGAMGDSEAFDQAGSAYVLARTGCVCVADTNGDGVVNLVDLLSLLAFWGTADPTFDIAPLGAPDGIVDIQDLLALLAAWGPCP